MDKYTTISPSEFEKLVDSFSSEINQIDVRQLEMPMPMITIVNELKKLYKTNGLLVIHHKVPQILLNDLSDENLKIFLTHHEDNLVKLFFIKI